MDNYVLVVDDDPDVRGLLNVALNLFGLVGREAANGREALEMVSERPPSAILLDLMMPGMDGFTTLIRLHKQNGSHKIPVILLSGLVDTNRRAASLPGVVGALRKGDFTIDRLRVLLEQAGCVATLKQTA